ncbi:MAG: SIS domain-containing protein [Alphaproteobacteria bacterium]|nr:SIS domain-containing protein [Alphaproteobacteria bacterium]
MAIRFDAYMEVLQRAATSTEATKLDGATVALDEGLDWVVQQGQTAHRAGKKVMLVGNGGSAGITSHVAIDMTKNGGVRAIACNDGAALTCLGNDFGYEYTFAKQINFHGQPGDILIAISSSGKSKNILLATEAAREAGMAVITLSGFGADNPLRRCGDVNFYVPSPEYGFVELSHVTLLHSIVDAMTETRSQ